MTTPAARQDAGRAAAALGSTWELWTAAVPGGWFRREGGLFAAVTGVALAGFNGVWTEQSSVDENALDELLEEVAATGLPHCLQVRPAAAGRVSTVAAARGMTLQARREPLMVLHDTDRLEGAQRVDGLTIRQLHPDEVPVHHDVSSRGFDIPEKLLQKMLTPELFRTEGTRFYVGEAAGTAVTTGSGSTIGESVGIFNIATPKEHRGHGYGAAVTARAVTDGLAAGAGWAYLQSSEAGYRVYERLGFEAVELWDCWVAPA